MAASLKKHVVTILFLGLSLTRTDGAFSIFAIGYLLIEAQMLPPLSNLLLSPPPFLTMIMCCFAAAVSSIGAFS